VVGFLVVYHVPAPEQPAPQAPGQASIFANAVRPAPTAVGAPTDAAGCPVKAIAMGVTVGPQQPKPTGPSVPDGPSDSNNRELM